MSLINDLEWMASELDRLNDICGQDISISEQLSIIKEKMKAGGRRKDAGRKSKWKTGENSARVTIQVPVSKVDEVKVKIIDIVKKYEKE